MIDVLPRHSVSTAGVITDKYERVLLVQRRDTLQWEPPGGVLELGETIHDGVIREVNEETGLDVEPIALTGIYKNMSRYVVSIFFRCKIISGILAPNNEAIAFRWATPGDITKLLTEAYAVRVMDALFLGEFAPVRAHNGVVILE